MLGTCGSNPNMSTKKESYTDVSRIPEVYENK